jgi:hypothetical protein
VDSSPANRCSPEFLPTKISDVPIIILNSLPKHPFIGGDVTTTILMKHWEDMTGDERIKNLEAILVE